MIEEEFPFNCPSCGAGIGRKFRHTKLVVCPHCQTSLFLEDNVLKNAGKMSVLTKQPSILELTHRFTYEKLLFIPVGHVRYDYQNGFWDEWWVLDDNAQGKWISVDEGDIAIEDRIEMPAQLPKFSEVAIGQEIKIDEEVFIATEKNTSVCIGAEGELPIRVQSGEKNDYVDFSGQNRAVCRIKYFSDRVECYKGKWIDVFELRALDAGRYNQAS